MEVATSNEMDAIEAMQQRCLAVKDMLLQLQENAERELNRRRPVKRNGDAQEHPRERVEEGRIGGVGNEVMDSRDRAISSSSTNIVRKVGIVEESLTALALLGAMETTDDRRAEFVRCLADNRRRMENIEMKILRFRQLLLIQ